MAIDRDSILAAAQKFAEKKRFDRAILEYQKLIDADPGDVRLLLKVGDLHLKLEQFQDAITVYERVGNHYFREGFSVKAIAVYKQIRGIVKRHVPHLDARYGHIVPRLAEIYTKLGLVSDALAAYDEVATRLRQDGRERDALDIFKKVVELDPQNPIAHLRVADSFSRLNDRKKAVKSFGHAADLMVVLGRQDDALKVLHRLLQTSPSPKYARLAGKLYLERGGSGDGMAAITKLQIAFKANPKDLDTLELLARSFDAIEQPQKSLEVYKEAARVAQSCGDPRFTQFLGELRQRAPNDPVLQQLTAPVAEPSLETSQIDVVEIDEGELLLEEDVFEMSDGEFVDPEGEVLFAEDGPGTDLLLMPDHADEPSAIRRLLNESERERNNGSIPRAVQILQDGIRNLGAPPTLRQRLSDLLLEQGDTAGSVAEKLILAQEWSNEGNVDGALSMLDEVLMLVPQQPDAVQMRTNLGFPPEGATGHIDSYDIEATSVDDSGRLAATSNIPTPPPPHAAPQAPYAAPQAAPIAPPVAPPPAPSLPAQSGGYPAVPAGGGFGLDDPFGTQSAPPIARRSGTGYPPVRQHLDEEALDRAEAMAEGGRYDEARAILHQQLQLLPNHPLILERLADIDALALRAPSGGYGSMGPGPGPGPASQPILLHSYPPSTPGHDYISAQPVASAPPEPLDFAEALGAEMSEVLEHMRQGVKRQVDDTDSATHYDLGVAYNEMGLYDDAISELTLASRDLSRECVCLSLIASIHLQQNEYEKGLDALHRALGANEKTREQEYAIGYEIANSYELSGMPDQALTYFDWLAKGDPHYRDPRGTVTDRLERLRGESGAQPKPGAPSYDDAANDE